MLRDFLRHRKNLIFIFFVNLGFVFGLNAQDSAVIAKQQDSVLVSKHKIALFAPLYLDSAFDSMNEYRYPKNVFPKFINPGLEFYEGAQLALDSLNKQKVPLEVFIYDTRSGGESLTNQLDRLSQDSIGLIIAHCAAAEIKTFADAGLKNNIPVINVNLPNDGGVYENPFFVVLNSTLKTQIEGIYRHIQRHYPLHSVVVFRKKGLLEDRIRQYFDDFGKSTMAVPLKMKYVDVIDSFTINQLKANLDSNFQTIAISGTLDENFGRRLVRHLATIRKQYKVTVMGMPTWDGIKDFTRPEYKGIEIVYSTPFYHNKMDNVSVGITNYFTSKMYARPSDMVYRGYEVTWKYARLLLQYGKDLASNLGNKQFKVFTDYDIQPVLNKQTLTLDYFENKKLYFIKWVDGIIKTVL